MSVKLDARRGTVIWGFNRFRSDALVQLLNDLLEKENEGLSDNHCEHVTKALGQVVNLATAIPDGSWFKSAVWKELQDFEKLYQEWNSHTGEDALRKRKKTLQSLRKKRNRIAKRIRRNQFILENELDLKLIEDMYGAFGQVTRALPDIFRNLAGAVGRFQKKSA